MRKMTLRAYIGLLRLEDSIRGLCDFNFVSWLIYIFVSCRLGAPTVFVKDNHDKIFIPKIFRSPVFQQSSRLRNQNLSSSLRQTSV